VTASPLARPADAGLAEEDSPRTAKEIKAAAYRTLILEGDIQRGVFAIALPSVATMLLQTTNSLLDTLFVGRLGTEAVAAITVASSLMFALMSAAMAVSVGTTALVARFIGEKSDGDAVTATTQSLMLGLVLSVLAGLPMYFLRLPLLRAMGLDDAALHLAARYLGVSVLGLPSLFLMLILNGAFRGLGDTVRPFWVSLAANGIHIGFNYLLIFGALGFPRMGLPGGATALVISQTVATILYVLCLRITPLASAVRGPWRIDWDWARRISRIGIPASAQQLLRVGSMLAFQGLLAHTPAASSAVAALGVGLRSESIAFMPGFGYSIAASAFVGQNLGARKVERANAGAWAATWQAVLIMTTMGILFATFAEPFAGLFLKHVPGETVLQTHQVDETIRLTAAYLHTAAWAEPFLALGMVLTGALQGAGETASPTWITIFTMVLLRVPLAALLLYGLHLGPVGAWWAMTVSTIASGALTVVVFRRGKWRQVEV
jgi:putative MATE family efflux protein